MNNYNTAYPINNFSKENKIKALKKACNKIGFLLVIAIVALTLSGVLLEAPILLSSLYDKTGATGISGIPYSIFYVINALCEFTGFFIVPLIFCLIFKFKLKDALPFNRKNKDNIFLLVIAGYSICTISNFAVSLLNSNLSLFNYENTTNVNLGADTLQDKILYFICIAIVPAITEEFCFRGVMLNYLRPYGDGFAILVSSIFFGLMHGNFVQIPFAFIVGLVCGYLVVHTNSMLPSILLHLLNNGTSIILDIVSNSTTEAVDNLVTSSVLFLLTLAGFIAIIALTKKGFKIKTHLENNNFSDIKTSIKIKNFLANPGIIIAVCIFLIEAFGLI